MTEGSRSLATKAAQLPALARIVGREQTRDDSARSLRLRARAQ